MAEYAVVAELRVEADSDDEAAAKAQAALDSLVGESITHAEVSDVSVAPIEGFRTDEPDVP